MSENWLKIDKRIGPKHPKVLRIVELTGYDPRMVVGCVIELWKHVDDYVKEDARLHVARYEILCAMFGIEEIFWRALEDPAVRWLGHDEQGFFIPNWDKWFSKSAKQRSENSSRARRYREGKKANERRAPSARASRDSSATQRAQARPEESRRDETRREEIREENTRASDVRVAGSDDRPGASGTGAGGVDAPRKALGIHKGEESEADNADSVEPDWQDALFQACRACTKLDLGSMSRLSLGDRSLLVKAPLAVGVGLFSDAIEGCRLAYARTDGTRPKGPKCGYLHGMLARMCDERKLPDFNRQLARLEIPPGLFDEPQTMRTALAGITG